MLANPFHCEVEDYTSHLTLEDDNDTLQSATTTLMAPSSLSILSIWILVLTASKPANIGSGESKKLLQTPIKDYKNC
jgi:hypothetical protein